MISLKINNNPPVSYNYSNYFNLSDILPYSVISQLTPSDSVELTLEDPGDYLITEAMLFYCNVTIIGAYGVVIKVRIPQIGNKESSEGSSMHAHSHYLGCEGKVINNVMQEINVAIKDIELVFSASHSFPYMQGAENDVVHTFIKIRHAKSIHLDNVKVTTDNDRINNVLIYDSHNVIVENCDFHNTHSRICNKYEIDNPDKPQPSKYTRLDVGGNLWFVGNNHDVVVRNNYLYKDGNDEAFSLYNQGASPEDDYDFRRNIHVEGNTFEYGSLEGDSIPCDVLITIQSSATQRPIRFDNIFFDGNHFIINDLVKNLLWLMIYNPESRMRGLRFSNNFIELKNFSCGPTSPGFPDNGYPSSILHLESSSQTQQVEAEVDYNNLISLCSITYCKHSGLRFISQNGGKVTARGNYITINNVSDDILEDSKNPKRIMLLHRNGVDGRTDLVGNHANGLFMTASITSRGDSTAQNRISNAEVNLFGNHLSGDTRIYVNNVDMLNANMHNNVIHAIHYLFGFQNFAKKGTIRFTENEVYSVSTDSPLLYHIWDSSTVPHHINRLYSIGNVVHASGATPIERDINADNYIIADNQYIQ